MPIRSTRWNQPGNLLEAIPRGADRSHHRYWSTRATSALAFSAANDDDMFKLFVAVDGSRSYMVLTASEKTHPDDADMDRCIDGFHLNR
jgi:hypothetical protein